MAWVWSDVIATRLIERDASLRPSLRRWIDHPVAFQLRDVDGVARTVVDESTSVDGQIPSIPPTGQCLCSRLVAGDDDGVVHSVS